ncbi:MAG: glucose-1-phosphate thymidylyltransferase RfbA [Magnetococcales bacterium]|nr:glucose-1-phosphate thymidylyltransferase RfbA [Magnetococcales bacterium]
MKGILLAGGRGSRLHPMTIGISKHLLPIYDKPMIYYSLSILMLAGIREIMLITTPEHQELYRRLLGDGSQWGLDLRYAEQPSPDGISQAFLIAREFIAGGPCALVLGDNLLFGNGMQEMLQRCTQKSRSGAAILGYVVERPERYGVVEVDEKGVACSLAEKPTAPRSNLAVPGIYFYDHRVVDFVEEVKPSTRGELEITDLNRRYLDRGELYVEILGRGWAWMDAGTPESLIEASEFIRSVEKRQLFKIACPEEIAFNKGYITLEDLAALAKPIHESDYGRYLMRIVDALSKK